MGKSSSTPSSSTTTNTDGEQYGVFISFRGEDTRKRFTSHLYQALHKKQIKTFKDDQLVRGEEISEGLWSAIGKSKISVIIFSENYAFSKRCLRELAEIMKYREMNNQIVIPVFYEVDPSHVRKQSGSYEAAFAKHENELQQEEVKKWREALTQASSISGFDSSKARDESELVCNIVRYVWNKLYNISPSCDFKDLVGIEKHIVGVVSTLCLEVQDFRIIGIWGMGGMGKTTIADAVFHLISHQFEKTYFAWRVREESEKDSTGLIRLRDKIISEVLNEKKLKIGSPSIPQLINRRLNQKKVLIVLDDLDKLEIFETLAKGLDRFGPGSRIMLTSRDKQVLHKCGVEDHNMYKVEGLNNDEALQLFCKHAFKQNQPTKDFEFLSREVVKIAKNVPLAVKVLGSLLNKKSKRDWENAADKFQRNVHHRVLDVLKIGYDGLDEEEKGLFLDIACFVEFEFEIDEVRFAPNLLSDRGFSLEGLIDKSLVTVEYRCIKMHDLLREMGREIVDKESPNKPGDCSRLWRQEDVLHRLKHNDGTDAVQGISLSMFNLTDVDLSFQALMKMYNLRTLIIKYGEVHLRNSGLEYLPDALRYLHWNWYPLEVLPSSFNPVNLVELDLSKSNIKQLWKGRTPVPKLKRLNLSYCWNLIRVPDLLDIPAVESINLEQCRSLLEIHSLTECRELKQLNFSGCENLIRIPDLSDIPSAESINLEFCSSLLEIHTSRECSKLKRLDLTWCVNLIRIPDLSDIPSVESINLNFCSSLLEIHSSTECRELKRLDLSHCKNLIRIPDLSDIPSAESINLEHCISLPEIHSSRESPKLKQLDLSCCRRLIRIPDLSDIPSAESINLEECTSLIEIHSSIECRELKRLNLIGCKNLIRLNLIGCKNLIRIPDLSDIPSAESIHLKSCSSLIGIHSSRGCPKLKLLNLSCCENLIRIPDLSDIPSAESIHLKSCSSLIEIHSSWGCPKLKLLNLSCCENLIRIPDLSDIPSAESIHLKSCRSLIEIHSSWGCPKLKLLNLSCCENLIRIPDLSEIPSAESIHLKSCSSLIEIHSSSGCPKLKLLNLSCCKSLIGIPDLSDIPSVERIDIEFCNSLREIHSSRECPKNLHSLNLLECNDLSRLPSNIHIEGSEFNLVKCINLTKFPHISGNIKRLKLCYSGVKEVPSTIQSLSKLESLKMEGCESLKHISSSICKLKSLEWLDLSGCRELESFPDIMEEIELKYLNLRGTAIKELPPSIGNLNRLEELDFCGCKNLERLPKSIKKLSKLYSLKLNDCGMLRSLPELPSSLRHLEAINCKQLIQSLPDSSSGSGSLYFNFINCLKMKQEAVSNILIFFRDSLRKMQLMGTEKIISLFERDEEEDERVEGSICLPGSEIPEWFSCYKNNGSSVTIPGLRNDCGRSSYIMGFAVCLVIGFEVSDIGISEWIDVHFDFHIERTDGQEEGFFSKFPRFRMPIEGDEFSYSDHIFLGYKLSSECYELFQKLDTLLANGGMSNYVGTSLEFNCAQYKVKYCGIQPIYVQAQPTKSVSINQDTGDTSGCNDTVEETCEPHPKRIRTEERL